MTECTWDAALTRYNVRRSLATRARHVSFSIETVGSALVVTPSTGRVRRITRRQFEASLPLIDRAGRGPLMEVSHNSSYIEAIVDDLRQAG